MAQALDKDSGFGQVSKNFQVYLIHINFFRNQKKTILSLFTYSVCDEKVKIIIAPKSSYILRCYYIRFSILYCLLAKKKKK